MSLGQDSLSIRNSGLLGAEGEGAAAGRDRSMSMGEDPRLLGGAPAEGGEQAC